MASSSTYGEYYDLSLTYAGDDNNPLSACYCFDLVNNLEHLRDMRSQYRVNWIQPAEWDGVSTNHYGVYFNSGLVMQHAFTHIFPWNISYKGGPLTPVIKVTGRGYTAADTLYVYAYMTGHRHDVGIVGAEESLYNEGRAWRFTGTASGTTISSVIATHGDDKTDDKGFILDSIVYALAGFDTWDIDANDTTNYFYTNVTLYRLSVYCRGRGFVTSVSLREFNE